MTAAADGDRDAVLISGASTGIGRDCALHLANKGFHVFAGVRREEDAASLTEACLAGLTPIILDITKAGDIAAAVERVSEATGGRGLSGLVNNAGIVLAGPIEYVPLDELRRQFEVNVIGQVALTQACMPLIRTAKGRVVNMSSVSGRFAAPFVGVYAASKFALEALTDSLRVELSPWGIEVLLIEPGPIDTPIWNKTRAHADDLSARMPALGMERYGAVIERVRAHTAQLADTAASTADVTRAVVHALTAARPKTRYLVGKSGRLQCIAAAFFPDRFRDWLVRRALKL